MSLKPYEFRSPAHLIEQVAAQVQLVPDTAYVVLVAHPSTEQRIVAIRRFQTPALIDDWRAASDEIFAVMQELAIPESPPPPTHAALSVLVRPGYCVFGPHEGHWMSAWSYSNHLTNAFHAGVILVTEHGWADFMTDTAGSSPTMAA
jgi:hypothetical protein